MHTPILYECPSRVSNFYPVIALGLDWLPSSRVRVHITNVVSIANNIIYKIYYINTIYTH